MQKTHSVSTKHRGSLAAYGTGAARVGTRYRSRSRGDPEKPTIRQTPGPDTGAERVGTPGSPRYGSRSRRDPIQEQVASGPPEAYDTGQGRVGTRYRSRASPAKETTKSTERGDTYTSREHKQFAMGYRCTMKNMTIRKNSIVRIDCFQLLGLVWVALAYTTQNECSG